MRWLKRILIFIVSFLVYHIGFGCNVFPVDENNILQAPSWYPILGILVSFIITFVVSSTKKSASTHAPTKGLKNTHFAKDEHFSKLLTSDNQVRIRQLRERAERERTLRPLDHDVYDHVVASAFPSIDIEQIIFKENEWRKMQQGLSSAECELETVDEMDGHAFERWCAILLKKIGFQNVEVTQGSGDQGVDILAIKDGIRYAIQCKCYSCDLGNKPVQEVNTGRAIYHCQIGAVMTNRHFTAGGKEAADATGILLWDRDWIQAALESTNEERSPS